MCDGTRVGPGRIRIGVAVAASIVVAVGAMLIGPDLQNGDTAVYNTQISDRVLGIRTTHIGYIVLGIVFDVVLPLETSTAMNFMCVCFGVLGACSLFFVALHHTDSWRLAAVAAVLGLSAPAHLAGMFLSEVDVVHAALSLTALAVYPSRPAVAGLLYGASVLVSPLSGLYLPVFLFTAHWAEGDLRGRLVRHVRRVMMFGVAASLVYAPVVALHFQDYVHGPRGLLTSPRDAWDPLKGIMLSAQFFYDQGAPVLPLALVGLWLAVSSEWHRRRGLLAVGLVGTVLFTALAGERFGSRVPAQLPAYLTLCVFAVMPGRAWGRERWGMALGVTAAAILLTSSWFRVLDRVQQVRREQAMFTEMAARSAPAKAVLVSRAWHRRMVFEYLVAGRVRSGNAWPRKNVHRRFGRKGAQPVVWFEKRIPNRVRKQTKADYALSRPRIRGRRWWVLAPRTHVGME